MEPKRLILGMAVTLALLGIWYSAIRYVNHVHPEYAEEQAAMEKAAAQPPTTAPAGSPQAPATGPSAAPATRSMPTMSAAGAAGLHFTPPPAGPSVAILGSGQEKDPYLRHASGALRPRAGIERVTLNQFRQSVRGPQLYSFQTPYPDHPETDPLAARTLSIDGSTIDTSDGWKLGKADASTVTFTEDLAVGEHPVAHLHQDVSSANDPLHVQRQPGL